MVYIATIRNSLKSYICIEHPKNENDTSWTYIQCAYFETYSCRRRKETRSDLGLCPNRLVYPVLHQTDWERPSLSRSAVRIRINFWRMVGLYINLWRLGQCTWVLKVSVPWDWSYPVLHVISGSDPLQISRIVFCHGYCRKTPDWTNQHIVYISGLYLPLIYIALYLLWRLGQCTWVLKVSRPWSTGTFTRYCSIIREWTHSEQSLSHQWFSHGYQCRKTPSLFNQPPQIVYSGCRSSKIRSYSITHSEGKISNYKICNQT